MTDPLDILRDSHVRRADRLIVARFADARAHAGRGDLVTASQRLADLQPALLGPGGSGAIGDAFVSFYRDAHREHGFDPEIHDPARRHPTVEGAAAVRTMPVMGNDPSRELAMRMEQARRGLVLAATTNRGDDDAERAATRAAAIGTWHEQQSTAIRVWSRGVLGNAQMHLLNAVGFLKLRPEFRDE